MAILVPTRSAARQLTRSLEEAAVGLTGAGRPAPAIVTRDEWYDVLHERLPHPPRRLSAYEREVMMRAAARDASSALGVARQSVRLRPGLVTQMLCFYDQLRRQRCPVSRFEELVNDTVSKDADYDHGAERMLAQTRTLAATFHAYERRLAEAGACDEHTLRDRLLTEPSASPILNIVVTIGDWIAEPNGLCLADFDLLTRLPGAQTIDVIATDALLAAGFHRRVHEWLPGLEEVHPAELGLRPGPAVRPTLLVPDADRTVFVVRDREEELIAIARRLKADPSTGLDRTAVVFKRPLPYLYLARSVFGGARLPYQSSDMLPLAAEPFAAALDLVFECVESGFTRRALVALLRSPHFSFMQDGKTIGRGAISALDRALRQARYLGGFERLIDLAATPRITPDVALALEVACAVADRLSPLATSAPASTQLQRLSSFVDEYAPVSAEDAPFAARTRRARAAVRAVLESLRRAHAAYDDPLMAIGELAADVRRWIQEHTFDPASTTSEALSSHALPSSTSPTASGVWPEVSAFSRAVDLVDDQAARYGDFDHMAIVGLIEDEWPERPRRNIFCSSGLLMALGWPSEQDRRAAAEARFADLLTSASRSVAASTVTLDDESLVEASALVDGIPPLRLSTIREAAEVATPVFPEEVLALDPLDVSVLDRASREWAEMRAGRSPAAAPAFHGTVRATRLRAGVTTESRLPAWSVSALETYLGCPFKFLAQHVLRLEDEPEDEEVMDPRTEGQFVHKVFEAFFRRWQQDRHGAITMENLETARAVFVEVVDQRLAVLSETEAALARTRLLGSPAAAGLGEAVLRMEAERPIPVVDRILERALDGDFVFSTSAGVRAAALRGKADRIDLLADGTFRLIDYKLGWPPQKARALQLPIYGVCAEQQLAGHLGRRWTLGEAAYLAFKGPRRVVPLFSSPEDRECVLAEAQDRLIATLDAIARGEFPPTPDDVHRCETCSYAAVCRKDYVGDV